MGKENNGSFKRIIKTICTKETLGLILIVFSLLTLVCLITREVVFFNLGLHVSNFLFGLFGYFSFIVLLFLIVSGYCMLTDKKFNFKSRGIKCSIIVFLLTFALLHAITSRDFYFDTYAIYLSDCYNAGVNGFSSATAGGVLFGLIMYWFNMFLSNIGVYIVFPLAIIATIFAFIRLSMPKELNARAKKDNYSMKVGKLNIEGYKEYPIKNDQIKFPSYDENEQAMQTLYIRSDDFRLKSKHDREPVQIKLMRNSDGSLVHAETSSTYLDSKQFVAPQPESQNKQPLEPEDIITSETLRPKNISVNDFLSNTTTSRANVSGEIRRRPQADSFIVSDDNSAESRARNYQNYSDIPDEVTPTVKLDGMTIGDIYDLQKGDSKENENTDEEYNPRGIFDGITDRTRRSERRSEPERSNVADFMRNYGTSDVEENKTEDFSSENLFTSNAVDSTAENENSFSGSLFDGTEQLNKTEEEAFTKPESRTVQSNGFSFGDMDGSSRTPSFDPSAMVEPKFQTIGHSAKPAEKKLVPRCTAPFDAPYNAPPTSLLVDYPFTSNNEDHEATCKLIEDFFADYNVPGVMVDSYIAGPVITRYDITVPRGVRITTISSCEPDLERELCATQSGIRIATVPGSNKLGIEVPNAVRGIVGLRRVLESEEFRTCKKESKIFFALGSDLVGKPIIDNIANAPHFLVAGATGSGKSVCLDAILISLLYNYGPDELKLVIVDPKIVTFSSFLNIPHLLVNEIISDNKRALAVLDWLITEMEARYVAMAEAGVDSIKDYNVYAREKGLERLPSIILVMDEYADLVSSLKKEIESKVLRLAQKSRAAGIYMIIALQKPVKELITTSIKSNLPGRIALKVTNRMDSMVILDEAGAEKLLGNGDLMYSSGERRMCRYQSALVEKSEINKVVDYVIKNNTASYDESIKNDIDVAVNPPEEESTEDTGNQSMIKMKAGGVNDVLFSEALHLAIENGEISASKLQISLGIGFQRASKIMAALERAGYIEPAQAGMTFKRRKVLVGMDVFEQLYGNADNNF